jgi:hypothetical protein
MEIALIGLVGVFLGVVLATIKDLWIGHNSRNKRAEYLAILISCIFDRFVDGCVAVVNDDGLFQGQPNPEGYRETQVSTPEILIQSIEVDWQSLPSNLMYEILSFPNHIEGANQKIGIVSTYEASPPDYEEAFEERQYQYTILGISAANLAERLRGKYNIPDRNYESWNPIDYLEKEKTTILKRRSERQEGSQAILNNME